MQQLARQATKSLIPKNRLAIRVVALLYLLPLANG